MRGKSHIRLGEFLLEHYIGPIPSPHRRAFLIGCVEPDRNPTTYLKGSRRSQWLRGHNYHNAQRYMARIAHRLEGRQVLSVWDYYTLGKLIHYTMDAFTYAHNLPFPGDLKQHRMYEIRLQNYFLEYLSKAAPIPVHPYRPIMDMISDLHRGYILQPPDICRDTQYALTACCCIAARLFRTAVHSPIGSCCPCPISP